MTKGPFIVHENPPAYKTGVTKDSLLQGSKKHMGVTPGSEVDTDRKVIQVVKKYTKTSTAKCPPKPAQ